MTCGANGKESEPAVLTFTNTYEFAPTSFNLQVEKQILSSDGQKLENWKVEGDTEKDWTDETFSFRLEADPLTEDPEEEENGNAATAWPSMPEGAGEEKGKMVKVVKTTQTFPLAAFGDIVFSEEGEYHYTITEVLPEGLTGRVDQEKKLVYDTTRYEVTVKVKDDGKGHLVPEVTYPKGASTLDSLNPGEALLFQNREFNDQIGEALPSTGGPGTRFFTLLGSILICLAGVMLWRRRRLA